jgi:hypothetical protein
MPFALKEAGGLRADDLLSLAATGESDGPERERGSRDGGGEKLLFLTVFLFFVLLVLTLVLMFGLVLRVESWSGKERAWPAWKGQSRRARVVQVQVLVLVQVQALAREARDAHGGHGPQTERARLGSIDRAFPLPSLIASVRRPNLVLGAVDIPPVAVSVAVAIAAVCLSVSRPSVSLPH